MNEPPDLGRMIACCGHLGMQYTNRQLREAGYPVLLGASRKSVIGLTLGLPVEAVSVKATTEEGLGFTGSGEGISAQAVVLLEQRERD